MENRTNPSKARVQLITTTTETTSILFCEYYLKLWFLLAVEASHLLNCFE
jgi:hypothetical protein